MRNVIAYILTVFGLASMGSAVALVIINPHNPLPGLLTVGMWLIPLAYAISAHAESWDGE